MAQVIPLKNCRLCGGNHLGRALRLAATPLGDSYLPPDQHPELLERYPLDLMLCSDCGHAQLSVLVDPGEIYRDYLYATSHSLGLPEHFRKYAEDVSRKLALPEGSLVIDIGSNDGTLLRAFQARGMKVLGIDPAREIARRATASGIPTTNDFFTTELAEKIRREHGAATLVIANNVIANVPNPDDFFSGVHRLLDDHSRFVWETGYVKYLVEDCVFDNIHHEHIDYYAVRPLHRYFENHGLELYDVETTTSKGSSLRSFVRLGGGHPPAESVRRLMEHEEKLGYFSPAPYQLLEQRLLAAGMRLRTLLSDYARQGKIVAGYGAAIGSTTVLHQFGIADRLKYLVDDNPVRIGLASPGFGLKVVGPDFLIGANRPDIVVILAWRYADPIISRNRGYLERGGTFLKILPKIEVISTEAPNPGPI